MSFIRDCLGILLVFVMWLCGATTLGITGWWQGVHRRPGALPAARFTPVPSGSAAVEANSHREGQYPDTGDGSAIQGSVPAREGATSTCNPGDPPTNPHDPPSSATCLEGNSKGVSPDPSRTAELSKGVPAEQLEGARPEDDQMKSPPPISSTVTITLPVSPPDPSHILHSQQNILPHAQKVVVHKIHAINKHIQIVDTSKPLFEQLERHIILAAVHDASERSRAPICLLETRDAVQKDVVIWGTKGDQTQRIMWLSGPLGSGKTAIAGSLASVFAAHKKLAASFFFSNSSGTIGTCLKGGFVATLAHGIAKHDSLHQYAKRLSEAIKHHPDVFSKTLTVQAELLLIEPFQALEGQCDTQDWPTVILVDGIDEVEAQGYSDPGNSQLEHARRAHEDDQREILRVILTLSQNPAFPFRILVVSRPENVIANFFRSAEAAQPWTTELFLDSRYKPEADIKHFLTVKFADIQRNAKLSTSWPGESAVDQIVHMSSEQFIVPSLIIRYIENGVDPEERLQDVLSLNWEESGENPLAALDALYCLILRRGSPRQDPHLVVRWVLCITRSLRSNIPPPPPPPPPAQFWDRFLRNGGQSLNSRLRLASSLIHVPPADDVSSPVAIYHKTLIDCLSSPNRCGDLYVDQAAQDSFVADRIVKVLKAVLATRSPFSQDTIEAKTFFTYFFSLELLQASDPLPEGTDPPICDHFSTFVAFLSEASKSEFAACDVARDTSLLLGRSIAYAGESTPVKINDPRLFRFLGGIYCGIHRGMKCGSYSSVSTEDPSPRLPHPICHAACRNWRNGILAKAKELNWCVHRLEDVEVGQLENVTVREFEEKFEKMGPKKGGPSLACEICQPT